MSEQISKTDEAQVSPEAESEVQPPVADKVEEAKETTPPETKVEPGKEESTAADKPEGKKTEEEQLSLTLPDGALLKPEHVEAVVSFAKEHGLSNAQAQSILERDAAMAADVMTAQQQKLDEVKAEWGTRASTDPEVGGAHFKESIELAHRALTTFGSEALRNDLISTGFGNHPELIRVFSRIGKAMAEDKFVHSKGQSNERKDPAKVLYGNM